MSTQPALLKSGAGTIASPIAKTSQWATTACILGGDFVTLSLVFGLAVLGRHAITPAYHFSPYFEMLPALALLFAAFWVQGLYPGALLHPAEEMRRIFLSITTVFLVTSSTTFFWHNAEAYSRSVFLITWAAGPPLVLLSRYALRRALGKRNWWGIPALVIGSGPTAHRVVRNLRSGRFGVKVIGIVSDEHIHTWETDLPPLLGNLSAAHVIADSRRVQYAILAMPRKSSLEQRRFIEEHCQGFGHVLLVPDMPGFCSLGISARELGGEVGFEVPQRLFHRSAAVVKRVLDIVLSSAALLLISPFFLSILIAIKVAGRGPAFYSQNRYGKRSQTFKALKFRTMVPDADRVLTDYLAGNPQHLFEWQRGQKLKNDPRVTPVGKWLRRFSLDELPQLLNVLVGQMSLVGPRPIVHAEIEKYGSGFGLYTRVRPGLTGLWQVSGRNNTTYEERVAFDEYYVRNWSIWLDSYILFRTVKVVVSAEGAY